MEQLLHTPEGVRDIYHEECAKKLALQNRLHKTLHLYGYHDIQTPMYEYFDVFRKEIGTIPSRELYKFFDRDGNTLVLRPDITPQIARASATLFKDDEFPASLQILADRNTLDYMHYETLMFALTHLFSRLNEEMRNEKR